MTTAAEWRDLPAPDKIALVQGVWERGKSALQIARSIGLEISRQAIIGLYHRNKALAMSHPLNVHSAKRPTTPKRERKPRAVAAPRPPTERKSAAVALPPAPIPARVEPPEFRHLALTALDAGVCKWPTGDPDFTFCGQATGDPLRSYCPYHRRLSYQAR